MAPRKKVCMVCGDKALGNNFNAITCESCKAFFRRNALLSKEFTCPFTQNCEITIVTRRFCQRCRLQKCFDIGMKKEHIMSEEEKIRKKKKIEQNRVKRKFQTEIKPSSDEKIPKIKREENSQNNFSETWSEGNEDNVSNREYTEMSPCDFSNSSLSCESRHDEEEEEHFNETVTTATPKTTVITSSTTKLFFVNRMTATPSEIVDNIVKIPENAAQIINHLMKTPNDAIDIMSKIINSPADAMKLISHLISYPGDALKIISKIMNSPFDALTVFTKFMSSPTDALEIITKVVSSPGDVLLFMRQLMDSPADALQIMNKFMSSPAEALKIINRMVNTNSISTTTTTKTIVESTTETSTLIIPEICKNNLNQENLNNYSMITSLVNGVQSPDKSNSIGAETDNEETNNNILDTDVMNLQMPINQTGDNINNFPLNISSIPLSTSGDVMKNIFEDVEDRPIQPNSIESVLCDAIKLEYETYNSLPQSCGESKILNEAEQSKLTELISAHKALYYPVDDDLSSLINDDDRIKGETNSQDPQLLKLINLTAVAIRRLIKMSKKINAFRNMCQEDQVALLKGGCTEMMIMRSVMSYDCDRATWKIPHRKGDMSNIKVDVLKLAKGNVYDEHDRFIRTFEPKWRTDENIILLMCAIVLFTPSRPRVIHSDVIKLEQNSYYYLLRRYLESVYPGCEAKSTFIKLIQKINEVQRLNEVIIGVYLNVNPSQVEPLLREIFDLKNH